MFPKALWGSSLGAPPLTRKERPRTAVTSAHEARPDDITRLNMALGGRYHIRRRLGEGGMATVYLADDPKHDRKVAVKVLRSELMKSVGSRQFLNEIRITANLQHPHILPLFDSGVADSFLYYVMPHVAGETLRQRLRRTKTLGIRESVSIATSVAAALHHAHGQHIVHRDIKPANVMLSDGLPLVLDFGIAGAIESAGAEGFRRPKSVLGTAAYMSPEQATGDPVDARSDIYALGCLLYEMVTGEPPYSAPSERALLTKVLMEPIPSARHLRSSVPPEVESVMRRALAKEPGDRFSSAAQVAGALAGRSSRPIEPDYEPTQPPESRANALAVLPFENLSDDPLDEYFSDGITDDIITALSRISGLRVTSRASALQYRKVARPLKEIADELEVGAVVDGSVRRSGDRVRIVVQLVDAAADEHLWSETYDRELGDIFRVQSQVATSVANAVRLELTGPSFEGIEGRGTRDSEAYDIYLQGRFRWNQRTATSVAESAVFFQRALERDPEFALAHAGLADANTVLGIYGVRRPSEVMEAARKAALRAVELDPSLGEARASLACVHAIYDRDWTEAEAGFRQAFETAPSYATGRHWLAMNLLTPTRRFAEAVAQLERAEELDPHSMPISVGRGILAFYERDYVHAAEALEASTLRYPRFSLSFFFLGQCWDAMGLGERALAPLKRAVELSHESSEAVAALGHALAVSGRTDEAVALAQRLENRARQRYVSPALLAQVELGLGRTEKALALLGEAAEVRATDAIWLGVRPVYDPLREEPAFQHLIGRLGISG